MTTKEYLNQLNTLRINIKICEDKIVELESAIRLTPAINYDKLDVKTSPQNKMENYVIMVEEKKHEWYMLKEIYMIKQKEIVSQIMQLDNPNHVKVLIELYDKGIRRIRTVADHMHYTERHVTRLHREALKEFAKKFL